MKPRIVILSAFLTPFRSGAEACAEEVPLRLTDRFHCTIITARLRRNLPVRDILRFGDAPAGVSPTGGEGISVIRVGVGMPLDKWLYPFLAPLVARKQQPHVIHAILETFAGLALHMCRWTCPQAKRLLTLQTTNRSFLKGCIARSADRVTAISTALARSAQCLGCPAVEVIPNGTDVHALHSACARHAKVRGRVLFVGRLERMKGVDILLQAWREARAIAHSAGGAPGSPLVHARLHIVGDGSQRGMLERLARRLGVASSVTFLGRLDGAALLREYAEAEIFCGPSRSEALGNVFLEAQAAGCGVIATNVGGIPDIVENDVNGILVPPEDVRALGQALIRMLGDAPLRARCAQAGIERSRSYDWQRIAERYAALYRECVGQHP